MEIWIYIVLVAATSVGFFVYAIINKPPYLKRSIIIGLIFCGVGYIWDFLGINVYHLWDNKISLLPELFGVPIGNIPFSIFGGAIFVLLWKEFEKPITKIVFLFTATGTCGYFVAITVFFGFLLHFPPYNIGWSYLFWFGNLSFMVLLDYLFERYVAKVKPEVVNNR